MNNMKKIIALISLFFAATLYSENGVELQEISDKTDLGPIPNTFVVKNTLSEDIYVSCSSTGLSPRAVPKISSGETAHVDIPGVEQGYAVCSASKCKRAGVIIFRQVLRGANFLQYALAQGFVMTISDVESGTNHDELRAKFDDLIKKRKAEKRRLKALKKQQALAGGVLARDSSGDEDFCPKKGNIRGEGCCGCNLWASIRWAFFDAWLSDNA